MSRKKQLLVTGATGLIGSYLCEMLLKKGHRVVAISRWEHPVKLAHVQPEPNFVCLTGDLLNRAFCRQIFANHKIEAVFHLACDRSVLQPGASSFFKLQDSAAYRVNYLATVNLLEAAAANNISGWLQSSTMNVFDINKENATQIAENEPVQPNGPNGISMYFAEQAVAYFARTYGFHHMILRYPGVYGRGKDGGVVAKFVRNALEPHPEPIAAPENRSSDFVYVKDLVDGNLLALAQLAQFDGEIFHMGSGQETTIFDLATLVKKVTNAAFNIEKKDSPDSRRFSFSSSKAQRLLGYTPRTVEYGLRDYVRELKDCSPELAPSF